MDSAIIFVERPYRFSMDYAQGNAAKAMVIDEILNRAANDDITVFDFGCGDGGQWKQVLRDYESVSYIGYEPDPEQAKTAEEELPDRVSIYTGEDPPTVEADYVVSFSVLEHVDERESYIRTLSESLAEDGIAYLNYDDGHFRNTLDLNHPRKWPRQIKAWIHATIGPLFAVLDDPRRYQKRVQTSDLRRMISASGLQVERSYYNNIRDLKGLAKNVPQDLREEYTACWIEFEEHINQMLGEVEGAATEGDDGVLWDVALSKTLVLRHEAPKNPH